MHQTLVTNIRWYWCSCESESHSVMSDSLWPHEIFQARILEWVDYSFSSGSSQPRNQTWVFCIAGWFFTNWAIREAQWCSWLVSNCDTCSNGLAFPGGSVVKNLPARQEMRIWSVVWEGPLEKEMATHSRILAWQIPWIEEPGGLQSMGSQRVPHDFRTKQHQQQQNDESRGGGRDGSGVKESTPRTS